MRLNVRFNLIGLMIVIVWTVTTSGVTSAQDKNLVDDTSWVRKSFDFKTPHLNFESNVPPDAKVETVPMDATEDGTIGKVKIIGKVTSGSAGMPIETTIVGYALSAPGAASRVCTFAAESSGYTPRLARVFPDGTEANILSNQSAEGKPRSAAVSYCFARSNHVVAVHFLVDVSGAGTADAATQMVFKTDAYAQAFVRNLKWADGEQSSFGDDLQSVLLRIDGKETRLNIPEGWDTPINDFHGPLPAELHLIRRKQGKDVGLLWLFVQDMKEKPDLEVSGAAIVKDYFVKQSADTQTPVLISSAEDREALEQGVAARTFRFTVRDRKGEDAGDIEATVSWHDGRLSVLSLWSVWTATADQNIFFSRLPGLTVYDIVRQATIPGRPPANAVSVLGPSE